MSNQTILAVVLMGLAGAAAGVPLARFCAWRTTKAPLINSVKNEARVLAEVLARPPAFLVVCELTQEDFSVPAYGRIWSAIAQIGDEATAGARPQTSREVAAATPLLSADIFAPVAAALDESDAEILAALEEDDPARRAIPSRFLRRATALPPAGRLSEKQLVKEGRAILAAHDDRTSTAGAFPARPTDDPTNPFARVLAVPSRARQVTTAGFLAAALAAVPWFVSHLPAASLGPRILAGAALVVLSVASIVLAEVDFDTLYVDLPVLFWGGGVAWALVVVSQVANRTPGYLKAGVLIAVVGFLFFEVINFFYRKVRGRHGMGFGDSLLLLATSGIPAALTGSEKLGWYSILFAMLASIAGYAVMASRKKMTAQTPFAFGPYLALGWIATFALLIIFPGI